MKKFVSIFMVASLFVITGCSPSQEEQIQKINQLEKEIMENYDPQLKLSLIELYTQYVKDFPDDSLASEYLFRTAEAYRALRMGKEALTTYSTVISKYPQSLNVPESFFFKGVIYEDILYDNGAAAVAYRNFIEDFPQHPLAEDARLSLSYLGKPLEEIIAVFEKMNTDTL